MTILGGGIQSITDCDKGVEGIILGQEMRDVSSEVSSKRLYEQLLHFIGVYIRDSIFVNSYPLTFPISHLSSTTTPLLLPTHIRPFVSIFG